MNPSLSGHPTIFANLPIEIVAMVQRASITAERLRELLDYCPETGVFTWRVSVGGMKVGARAGCRNNRGYVLIRVDGTIYVAHRLAWLFTTGCWPAEFIDHVNCDRSDNRLVNLREATHAQNQANARLPSNSTVGLKGVTRRKSRWEAQIKYCGEKKYLGLFDTPEAAHAAYVAAAKGLFGDYARAA